VGHWPADRLLAYACCAVLYFLAQTMTTSFQKTLAVLTSVASVLAGVVTIASFLSGGDVALPPSLTTPPSDSQPIIIHARAVFMDDDKIYIIDYNNTLIAWNESLDVVQI